MSSTLVLILKGLSEDVVGEDPYIEKLNSHNISAKLLPTLQFQFKNLDVLVERLNSPIRYSGLIFSSPRCVKAVVECTKNSELPKEWHDLKCFAVGETTGKLIQDTLHLNSEGSSSGNMTNLIKEISKYSFKRPLLMPIGNLHKGSNTDFEVEKVEVYDTSEHSQLQILLENVFNEDYSQFVVVFFSPSGVKSALPHIPVNSTKNLHFIAIGPTTAAEMKQKNLPIFDICEKPSPDGLVDVVTKLLGS